MTTLPDKDLFRPDEVAAYFSLNVKTIYGWIDTGKLEAVKVGPNHTLRITREAIEKIIRPVANGYG